MFIPVLKRGPPGTSPSVCNTDFCYCQIAVLFASAYVDGSAVVRCVGSWLLVTGSWVRFPGTSIIFFSRRKILFTLFLSYCSCLTLFLGYLLLAGYERNALVLVAIIPNCYRLGTLEVISNLLRLQWSLINWADTFTAPLRINWTCWTVIWRFAPRANFKKKKLLTRQAATQPQGMSFLLLHAINSRMKGKKLVLRHLTILQQHQVEKGRCPFPAVLTLRITD